MNYEKLYYKFIEKFKIQNLEYDVYTEKHHIIPRYFGGLDNKENLVEVTHRQHTFLHHLWAKYTDHSEAWLAYKMMAGQNVNFKLELAKLGGKKNKESGWLDKIRHLANTPIRQQKLKNLIHQMKVDGRLDFARKAANRAWKGNHHTDEFKIQRSEKYKQKFLNDKEYREKLLNTQKIGVKVKQQNSEKYSLEIIQNAQRNVEWLKKKSRKSKNIFISPEGLIFDSPIYAAKYYGNVDSYVIENWCKRKQHGWNRIPKDA